MKHVNVSFTLAEAVALLRAAGNSLCSLPDAVAVFNENHVARKAAYRAANKLQDAIHNRTTDGPTASGSSSGVVPR